MYTVYLGLGSNLGDRLEHLSQAMQELSLIAEVRALSSVYETEPVGMDVADPFFNMAACIITPDDPPLLLVHLKTIEKKLGRKRHSHMQSRTIDIDILLYRGFAYDDHTVRVPHPSLQQRRFALEPLHEIAPTAIHPLLEKTIATLLRQCRDRHSCIRTDYQINVDTAHQPY